MSLIEDLLQFIQEGQKLYLLTFGADKGLYLWKIGNKEIERKSMQQLFLLRDVLTWQHGEHSLGAMLYFMQDQC